MFYSEKLPKSPTAVATARELVERVREELSETALEDARLLISELVANAVEHAQADGMIEVNVALSEESLRVEVIDPGPGFEYIPRAGDSGDERGWGLHFTDRLAKRWAIERGERTRVWFEIDTA